MDVQTANKASDTIKAVGEAFRELGIVFEKSFNALREFYNTIPEDVRKRMEKKYRAEMRYKRMYARGGKK